MSISLVMDCSVSASWFLTREQESVYESLLADILEGGYEMIVPDLWWYEVMNVIRGAMLRQRIEENDARQIFVFLKGIPKRVIEIGEQGQFGILKLAMEETLSVYDAAYLYLAISNGADLVTSDTDLLGLKDKYSFIRDVSEYK